MKTIAGSMLCAVVCLSAPAAAQTPVGALAIDERQGDQYGWAVDYETATAAGTRALSECGSGCSVVLTFGRCAAYAADQDADGTAVGWAESFASADGARQAALGECGSRGGTGCIVRVWGCNSHVVEEGLGLDRAARRQIQEGLQAAGFNPGGADGMFGSRTRAAIRSWQTSRGVRATGYLDDASVAALRPSLAGQPTFGQREPQPQPSPAAATAEQENLFWQSIMNSENPVEFEAYLAQFPNGVFRSLAEARLSALRSPGGNAPVASRAGVVGAVFRPKQTCAVQPAGTSCWMEISQKPGCYIWNGHLAQGARVTWTGACAGGKAEGTGTFTWVWDGNRQTETGRVVAGERAGHWVLRQAAGTAEGLFVAGQQSGHWVQRNAAGTVVAEGPFVADERHGGLGYPRRVRHRPRDPALGEREHRRNPVARSVLAAFPAEASFRAGRWSVGSSPLPRRLGSRAWPTAGSRLAGHESTTSSRSTRRRGPFGRDSEPHPTVYGEEWRDAVGPARQDLTLGIRPARMRQERRSRGGATMQHLRWADRGRGGRPAPWVE